jgi:hypothetical protein
MREGRVKRLHELRRDRKLARSNIDNLDHDDMWRHFETLVAGRREKTGTIPREGETVSKVLAEQYDTVPVIPGIPVTETPAGHRQAR